MFTITRRELYNLLQEKHKWDAKYEHAFSHVHNALDLGEKSKHLIQDVRKSVIRECSKIKEKWSAAGRKEDRFLADNSTWLDASITFAVGEEALSDSEAGKFQS